MRNGITITHKDQTGFCKVNVKSKVYDDGTYVLQTIGSSASATTRDPLLVSGDWSTLCNIEGDYYDNGKACHYIFNPQSNTPEHGC